MKYTLQTVGRSPHYWPDGERQQLVDRAERGNTIESIAREHGRSPAAIYSQLATISHLKNMWPPPVGFDVMTFDRAVFTRERQDRVDDASDLDDIGARKKQRTRYHQSLKDHDSELRDQMLASEPADPGRLMTATGIHF
jgi:transposase-like protein